MSEPKYRPGIIEPVLYLFFWFFQTWGWIILFLFLGMEAYGMLVAGFSGDGGGFNYSHGGKHIC